MMSESLNVHGRKISEHLGNIESKIKHLNSSLDSLHVKSNIFDTHIKQFVEVQSQQSTLVSTLSSKLSDLTDRSDQLEPKSRYNHSDSDLQDRNNIRLDILHVECSVDATSQASDLIHSTKIESQHSEITNDPQRQFLITECDVLILSDSMLKRIQPRRFNPNSKTVVRFIRGGANTSASFVGKKTRTDTTRKPS